MILLYVETNYILELAFAQEQSESCQRLLEISEQGNLRLVIPAFSISECFETLIRRSNKCKQLADAVSRKLREIL